MKVSSNGHGVTEAPPPPEYAANPDGSETMLIACRVCGAILDITSKTDQHVVKCDKCNEATVRYFVSFFDCC